MAAHLARMQSGREGDGAVGHHLAAADRDGDRADGLAGILHDDSSPQRGPSPQWAGRLLLAL
ncbi:MAG: hypothetical protein ACTMKY_10380 [Dermabacteraceae bacterium]